MSGIFEGIFTTAGYGNCMITQKLLTNFLKVFQGWDVSLTTDSLIVMLIWIMI